MGCSGSKEPLDPEDLEYLLLHTNYDEHIIQQLYENFKKDCPNGELSRNQFYEMYLAAFPGKNANEFIDHAFKTFDTDGSGYIDFKEFILAIDKIYLNNQPHQAF